MTKEEYRNELKRLSAYVAMKELLRDMEISSSNYYAFMAGEDRRLGSNACERIINVLMQRPISPDNKNENQKQVQWHRRKENDKQT